jgi:hypothetical protein
MEHLRAMSGLFWASKPGRRNGIGRKSAKSPPKGKGPGLDCNYALSSEVSADSVVFHLTLCCLPKMEKGFRLEILEIG